MSKLLKSRRGITLVEALVAGVIILVAGAMLALGFGSITSQMIHSTQIKNETAAVSALVANGQGIPELFTLNIGYGVDLSGQIVRYSIEDQPGAEEGSIGLRYYQFLYQPITD